MTDDIKVMMEQYLIDEKLLDPEYEKLVDVHEFGSALQVRIRGWTEAPESQMVNYSDLLGWLFSKIKTNNT